MRAAVKAEEKLTTAPCSHSARSLKRVGTTVANGRIHKTKYSRAKPNKIDVANAVRCVVATI